MHSALVLLHVCSATVGLLSGALAMVFRKGSSLHRAAGSVFFVSMLLMSTSATYMAIFMKPVMMNAVVGTLTFYLVVTAWMAARRRSGKADLFDLAALLPALAAGVAGLAFGFEAASSESGMKDGGPAAIYFIFGTIALLFAVSDVRMYVRGGVTGTKRIARHLWRMCLALLIATLSFYPGQARLFSKALRETNLLFIPLVVFAGMTLFWMARMRTARAQAVRS